MESQLQPDPIASDQKPLVPPFLLLIMALLAIGLAPTFVRFSIAEISPNATVFNRFWIAGLIFGVWQGVRTIRHQAVDELPDELPAATEPLYSLKIVGMLLLMSSLYTAIQLLWAWSLTQTSVASSVTILHGLRPLLTTLGGWVLFKHRYDSKFLIGMAIAILGTILVGFSDYSDSVHKLQGDLLSVLSAICSALELLLMERLLVQFKTQTLMLWCCGVSALIMMVVVTPSGTILPISSQGWVAVISLALLSQVIGHGLITYSLNYLSSGTIAIAMLLDPIISALFAWILLSEQISILNGAFCCIVLLGIAVSLSSQDAVKTNTVETNAVNVEPLLS